jgi:hypothetical protein
MARNYCTKWRKIIVPNGERSLYQMARYHCTKWRNYTIPKAGPKLEVNQPEKNRNCILGIKEFVLPLPML